MSRRKPTMVARYFERVGLDVKCRCPTCKHGSCTSDECVAWMWEYGEMFERYPGQCKECMGTGWQLQFLAVPLDENGARIRPKQNTRTDATGKKVRVVEAGSFVPRPRKPPKKPIRNSPPGDDSVQSWLNAKREKRRGAQGK